MTVICWFRRVARLGDHPALVAAAQAGAVIPLVVLDPDEARRRPASAARQTAALAPLAAALARAGSQLIVRRGAPQDVLRAVMQESAAREIHTTAGFPFATDAPLRDAFPEGLLHFHDGGELTRPGALLTASGTPYRVFTPFWRALRSRPSPAPLPVPVLRAPASWPASDGLGWPEARAAMGRGWPVVMASCDGGEAAAIDRLDRFLTDAAAHYPARRDAPWRAEATSGLSSALAVGEISARQIWRRAMASEAADTAGVEAFLRQLAWRAFSRELYAAFPDLASHNWRDGWQSFPWRDDSVEAEAWRQGRTGVALVDAGMRELYATGRMHNRVRMVAASYLTKHLLTDWRVGLSWFEATLADWDPACNAVNWQWVAGCGPDAAPFFRIFNPERQAAQYDPAGAYRACWLEDGAVGARAFAAAIPSAWRRAPAPRLTPDLDAGRSRALDSLSLVRR